MKGREFPDLADEHYRHSSCTRGRSAIAPWQVYTVAVPFLVCRVMVLIRLRCCCRGEKTEGLGDRERECVSERESACESLRLLSQWGRLTGDNMPLLAPHHTLACQSHLTSPHPHTLFHCLIPPNCTNGPDGAIGPHAPPPPPPPSPPSPQQYWNLEGSVKTGRCPGDSHLTAFHAVCLVKHAKILHEREESISALLHIPSCPWRCRCRT
jgi:hypothetical protein